MKRLILVSAIFYFAVFADDLSQRYTAGEGAKFDLALDGVSSEVMIYVSHSTAKSVGVETYFSSKDPNVRVEMWQQAELLLTKKGVEASRAFLYHADLKAPEIIPIGKDQTAFELGDFLTDKATVGSQKLGEEALSTAAGTVKAIHYRKKVGAQVYDFWVSDEAKPFGLVKLGVRGKNPFQMTLSSLVKNVSRKIDPAKAVPLTSAGKAMLGLAQSLPLP